MNLTDAGRRHLLEARATVNKVDLLLAQMATQPPRLEARLRGKAPTCMLGAYLSEVLNHFQALHPGISLEVLANFELATMRRHVVASPSYLAKRGTPRVLADLVNHVGPDAHS